VPIIGSSGLYSPWWYRSVLDESRPLHGADPFAGAVASPVALLRRDALNANITAMQDWCNQRNVRLAPHGKTTMAPRLYRRQLTAGAWGITVASPAQARIALKAGPPRILIANEVTDLAGIRWLGAVRRDYPEVGLFCYVDGLDGVTLLENALAETLPCDTRLDVLIELGILGGRAGARDESAALAVGRAVAGSARLRLAGVAGYEGIPGGAADAAGTAAVQQFCRRLRRLAGTLRRNGLIEETPGRPMVLSAGGSIFFDDVVAALTGPPDSPGDLAGPPPEIVLRSGCYVTHDHGLYHRLTPAARGRDGPCLRPALEVWGRVLSRPEATRAIVDVGRRDVSYDQELPYAMWRRPAAGGPASDLTATVVALNDQHAFLDLPGEEALTVGEWVGFGISHPCTTVEKWNVLLLVDGSGRIVEAIDTFF
jgi:D-serine deaminase-like pyridoxal phosphate-dependent protein